MTRRIGFVFLGLALVALFAVAACQEGESVFDVQVGDCVVSLGTGAGEEEAGRVRTVDCSEPHDGEVVAVFDVEGDDFPGEDALFDMASEGCPSEASSYLYPTEDSWNELGDREISCFVVSLFNLAVGDCLNYPPAEDTVASIERRPCEDSYDAQVTDLLEMPDAEFPGDEVIAEYAEAYCPEGTDNFLGPTSESWELFEDRQVICLDE